MDRLIQSFEAVSMEDTSSKIIRANDGTRTVVLQGDVYVNVGKPMDVLETALDNVKLIQDYAARCIDANEDMHAPWVHSVLIQSTDAIDSVVKAGLVDDVLSNGGSNHDSK
ncbi:hypothetical protein AAFX24_07915 [Vibrio mediterranei]|uniref:hypothetical protein n=1 Tax=Vibrio mediterranei TaxID=689 RepID=UPI0038CE7003